MSGVMKKTLLLLLVLMLMLAFVACGEEDTPAVDADETEETETVLEPQHTHRWLEATCDAPKTCRICKETEGKALGHSTEAEGDRAANCTDKAYCSRCESEYGEALGHDMAEATCTEPSTCKNGCGYTEGEALGHSTEAEGDREATCTEKAYCSRCDSEYGEPLGHSTEAEGDRAATCTEKAYCSRCESEYGESLGHSTTAEGDRAATCTDKAYCSRCESEYGEVDPDAHDMAPATCTEPSTCKNGCGHSVGDPLGHSTTAEGDRAATCTDKAYCSRCESEYGEVDPDAHDMAPATCTEPSTCKNGCEHTVGDPLGHSTTAEGDRAATCTEKAYCSVCQSNYGEVDPDAHDMAPATCTEPSTCKNGCEHTVGDPLGHSYGAWVTTKKPTDEDEGEKQKTCGGCGDVVVEIIPPKFIGGDIIIIG